LRQVARGTPDGRDGLTHIAVEVGHLVGMRRQVRIPKPGGQPTK
jgi:hypothetical protein